MVHYSYTKESVAGREWRVQDTGIDYDGSRELGAYVEAVIAHGHELIRFVDDIERLIRSELSSEAHSLG